MVQEKTTKYFLLLVLKIPGSGGKISLQEN